MAKSKQWICYFYVKCLGSVYRMIQHYDCFFSKEITCDVINFMLCSTLINPFAWLSAEKQAIVNISMSLLFLILSLPSGSSKTKSISQKLYNPLDSMPALEVYLHLYMGNNCIFWRLLWNFFLCSHFEWCHRGQNLGLQPIYCDSIPEEMLHQSNPYW